MKKYFLLLFCFVSFSSFASTGSLFPKNTFLANTTCGDAVATSNPNFCSSFKKVATCNCENYPVHSDCSSMDAIYETMIDMFDNLNDACDYASHTQNTTQQQCINDWNYYHKHC